jgi:hypothetical protein
VLREKKIKNTEGKYKVLRWTEKDLQKRKKGNGASMYL